MIIFLIGFMGSGKSTIGKKLAARLHIEFIDLDNLIELSENKSIQDIFSLHGEAYFRKTEQYHLHQISEQNRDMVIATGGGTPCFYNNMNYLNKKGITVYIQMDHKSLHHRLQNSKKRPLLQKNTDKQDFIKTLLSEREHTYNQAKITINGLNINIDDLVNRIKSIQGNTPS